MSLTSWVILIVIIVIVLVILFFIVTKLLKGCLIRAAIGLVVLAALAYFAYRYFVK
jgi:hypothetical protein